MSEICPVMAHLLAHDFFSELQVEGGMLRSSECSLALNDFLLTEESC